MKKKFFNLLLICGLVVGALVSCSDDDFDSVGTAETDLSETTLDAYVTSQVSSINSYISTLKTAKSSVEEEITELNNSLASAEEDDDELESLTSQLSTLTALFNVLDETITALENTVSANYDDVMGQISALSTTLSELSAVVETANDLATDAYTLASENSQTISDIQKQLEELQSSVNTDLELLKSALTGALQDIAGNTAAIEAIEDILDCLGEEGDYGTLSEALDSLLAEAEAYSDSLYASINLDENSTVADLQYALDSLFSENDSIDAKIDSLITANDALTSQVSELQAKVDLLLGLASYLKALVFSPELYYQGIEAIGVYSYTYNAYTVADADITIDQSTDAPTAAEEETSVAPGVVASYYLNPSNAAVDLEDLSKYAYIVNNATYTRATLDSADITITGVAYGTYSDGSTNTGKIDVTFDVDATNLAQISDTLETSSVDVIALQYTYKGEEGTDTTITSDFAALKKYVISDFGINKVDIEDETDELNSTDSVSHLATTAAAAIARGADSIHTEPYFTLVYNEELDLDEWINVHYNASTGDCSLFGNQTAINKQNFYLEYELIGYIKDGSSATNESNYATISEGSIVKAVGAQAVGHSPLIRVTLVDKNGEVEQIAAVGYIVVVIVDDGADLIVEAEPVETGYYLACNDAADDAFYKGVMSASELEENILTELGLHIDEFEGIYSIVTEKDTVVQYTYADNTFTENTDAYGIVYYISYDNVGGPADQITGSDSVLSWKISYEDANKAFADGSTTISTYVKFVAKDTVVSRKDVYVKLTWNADAKVSPVLTIEADNKIQSEWYALNSREKGDYEIELQPGASTDQASTAGCNYSSLDIAGTFIDTLTGVFKEQLIEQGYTSLANSVAPKYIFAPTAKQYMYAYNPTGETGTVYSVEVNADGDSIYAVADDSTELIATIDTETGELDINTASDYTKDIINGVETRDDLKDMLTLTVWVDVDVCDEVYDYFTVENKRIEVKVLTPIFVGQASEIDLQLNKYTAMTDSVEGLDLTDFNGYDDADFYKYSDSGESFYDFYGVTSIIQDTASVVLTNYGRGYSYDEYGTENWTEIGDSWFTITYNGLNNVSTYVVDGVLTYYGTVSITQADNMSRSSDFQVLIPIVVEYTWGSLHGNILVNVKMAD